MPARRPRPFTRAQQLENRAFLRALERGGNIRLAAREVGIAYGTMQHRRRVCAAFRQRWDAALAVAQARLATGGRRGPEAANPAAPRTDGGEAVVVRRNDGRLQVRRAQPGKLTRACEQAFLAALSATCNVRLAAAAGASARAFHARRRRNPAFDREWRLALAAGYDRLEAALLESAAPAAHADDAWRHNEPPAMPPMTANQALQLMYLHQKEARLLAEPPHLRRRRGESGEAQSYRFKVMYELGLEREREKFRVAEAARAAGEGEDAHPTPVAPLPDLAQVTGWSAADPAKSPQDAGRALFGGWRLGDARGPDQAASSASIRSSAASKSKRS